MGFELLRFTIQLICLIFVSFQENDRMENELRSCTNDLSLERKKFIRLEKELAISKNLKEKVIHNIVSLKVIVFYFCCCCGCGCGCGWKIPP